MTRRSPRGSLARPDPGSRRRLLARVLTAAWLTVLLAGFPARAAPTPDPTATEQGSTTAPWQWPLRPAPDEVVHGFDAPDGRWAPGHRGVDLGGRPGEEVRAAGAGVVSYAGLLAGRGVVTITHGTLRTTYEPVTAAVGVGERVHAGDVIATLDLIGGHCLPRTCLHWGLLRGDIYLDPLSLVGAGPVRLLPDTAGVPPLPDPPVEQSATTPLGPSRGQSGGLRGSPPPNRNARMAAVLGGLAAGGAAVAVLRRRRLRR